MSLLSALASRQLLVVTGKGGVGKSVVSMVLARLLAASGRRVLLLEVDPRENLHELAGVSPSGGDVVRLGPGLRLQNLQPKQVIEQVVRDHLRVEWLVRRVVASPVFTHFVDAAPGLKELAILGHAFRVLHGHAHGVSAETVVLDAPATGHGMSLLAAPLVVSDVIRQGPFGHMASDLATLVGDPARTGIVVVTMAEEMPAQEALELRAAVLAKLGRSPDLLLVNALYPDVPVGRSVADDPTGLAHLWFRRRAINDRELAGLRARWAGPIAELPYLPVDRGPSLADALEPALRDALAAAAEVGA